MKLTLGFSPCPNDTFIFDALVNSKISTEDLEFDFLLEDVQTLNERAIEGKVDISKISYGVLPLVLDEYVLLDSGGALGKGVGPLLIANKEQGISKEEVNNSIIAIPGENTTAHLLFSLAFPNAKNKIFTLFNEIEEWLIESSSFKEGMGRVGVIIHETRFTYLQKGLVKLMDLGEYWEQNTQLPIPLGGIVAKRNLDNLLIKKVERLIRKSIRYAYEYYHEHLSDYVKQNAQEMSEEVMRQHINLYVNNYSFHLEEDGKKAVRKLMEVYHQLNKGVEMEQFNIFA